MRKTKRTADESPLSNNRMAHICRVASVAFAHGKVEKAKECVTRVFRELVILPRSGEMNNATRAEYGALAVASGNPDHEVNAVEENDSASSVADTLANIMHYCEREGIVFGGCLSIAESHFNHEVKEAY